MCHVNAMCCSAERRHRGKRLGKFMQFKEGGQEKFRGTRVRKRKEYPSRREGTHGGKPEAELYYWTSKKSRDQVKVVEGQSEKLPLLRLKPWGPVGQGKGQLLGQDISPWSCGHSTDGRTR